MRTFFWVSLGFCSTQLLIANRRTRTTLTSLPNDAVALKYKGKKREKAAKQEMAETRRVVIHIVPFPTLNAWYQYQKSTKLH